MKYNMPFAGSNYNRQIISAVSNTVGNAVGSIAGGSGGGLIGTAASSLINPISTIGQSHVQRGGGWGGIVGALGHQYPYLILERPELQMAENYDHSVGQPNETTDYLSNHSGEYVKVRSMHIEIGTATTNELHEIETLLAGGVIV